MTHIDYKNILNRLKEIVKGTLFENHLFSVGGAVRDFVMGNEIKDIDLVLDIPDGGIRFAEWMEENGFTEGSVVTYPTYGTAMFRMKDFPRVELECVQTRKEQYKDKNSRNPETTYGTLLEDAMRRDLTINALYYDIYNDKVLDITGKGLNDIENHILRVTSTPEIVFFDDGLRLMRVCRFKCRFGWEIEKDTFDGMVKNAHRLSTITKERIQDELNKMLISDRPVEAIETMKEIGLLKYVIPELEKTIGLTQNQYHFGDVYSHILKTLDNVGTVCKTGEELLKVRIAALLHDIGKINCRTVDEKGKVHFYQHELLSYDMVKTILKRLKYCNDFINDISFIVKNHMITKQWGDDCKHMKDKKLRKLQYTCGEHLFYMLCDLINGDNMAHEKEYCMPNQIDNILERTEQMIDDGTCMFKYVLPVNGNDIMEYKNLKPSKEVKMYLDYLLKVAFSKPKITKDECFKLIKNFKLC